MKNDKGGNNVTKIIAGVTTASLVVGSSCSSVDDFEEDDIYNRETIADESKLGEVIIPISLKLKPEDISYISAIQKLSNDIIENKDIAKKYINNPTSILNAYGYHGTVKEEDYLLKLVLAFGDDEINNAIKNRDIVEYFNLCEKKGILEENGKSIFNDEFYQQQKIRLSEVLDSQTSMQRKDLGQDHLFDPGDNGGGGSLFLVAALAVVVVAGVGVAATVGAVFTTYVVAGHTVYVYARSVTKESDILGTIYMLKSDNKDYYLLMDEEKNKLIDETILYIRKTKPKYFETNSEESLRNILRYNLTK